MPFFDDTVKKYLLTGNATIDWNRIDNGLRNPQPGDQRPQQSTEQDLTGHLMDFIWGGPAYFTWLLNEMDQLIANPNGAYFWIHGWYFDLFEHLVNITLQVPNALPEALRAQEATPDWELAHEGPALKFPGGNTLFTDKLEEMVAAGVEVRVIGWLSPIQMQLRWPSLATDAIHEQGLDVRGVQYDEADDMLERNLATAYSLLRLRILLNSQNIIFNTLSHPLGGAHSKMVVLGNGTYRRALTGGVDCAPSRAAAGWSDASVCVEGKAATKAAKFFQDLWNEICAADPVEFYLDALDLKSGNIDIPMGMHASHYGQAMNDPLQERAVSDANRLQQENWYVQLYRTLPRKRYCNAIPGMLQLAASKKLASTLRISSFQALGLLNALHEVPYLYTPALQMAPNGCFEFKAACFQAVSQASKYIFIMDQDLCNMELMTWINARIKRLRRQNTTLRVIIVTEYVELDEADPQNVDAALHMHKQIKMHEALCKGIARDHWEDHFIWIDAATHAKVMIVDDVWLSVGSANCARRSFYTDIEMGMCLMHESLVRSLRSALWSIFSSNVRPRIPNDTDQALGMWFGDLQRANLNVNYNDCALDYGRYKFIGLPNARLSTRNYHKTMNFFEDPDSNLEY